MLLQEGGDAMNLKVLSLLALVVLVACLAWLAFGHSLVGTGPVTWTVQGAAVLLMLWARMTFGARSFHAAANPTEGGLVTSGPYRYLRHPIYAAVLYFAWAGIAAHLSMGSVMAGLVLSMASAVRIFSEESLLVRQYPEYAAYSRRTARVIPFAV